MFNRESGRREKKATNAYEMGLFHNYTFLANPFKML